MSGKARRDGSVPPRPRTPTFYDRLEEARLRRQVALAARKLGSTAANRDTPAPEAPDPARPLSKPLATEPVEQAAYAAPQAPEAEPARGPAAARRRRRRGALRLGGLLALLVGGLLALAQIAPDTDVAVLSEPPSVVAAPVTTELVAVSGSPSIVVLEIPRLSPPRPTRADAPSGTRDRDPARSQPILSALAMPDRGLAAPEAAEGLPRSAWPEFSPRPAARPQTETSAPEDGTAAPIQPDLRVVLHVPNQASQTIARDIVTTVAARGFTVERSIPADFSVSSTNVRYFHAEDAEAAAALSDAIGATLRDFTSYRPSPATGIVEIWMAGRGVSQTDGSRSGFASFQEELRRIENEIRRALGG